MPGATRFAVEMDRAAARALRPQRTRHRDDFVADHRQIDELLALGLQRLLADEPADARRRRRAGFGGLGDAHRVVAHRGGILGVRLEQVRRGHDRIERVVDVVHDAGGELADRGESTFARPRFLQREQLGGALLHHPLETLGFRRHPLVQLGGAPRFFLERLGEVASSP